MSSELVQKFSFKRSLNDYCNEWIFLIAIFILGRLFLDCYLVFFKAVELDFFKILLVGLIDDLSFLFFIFLLLFPFYLLANNYFLKTTTFLLRSTIYLLFFIEILLQLYLIVSEQILTYATISNVSSSQLNEVTTIYGFSFSYLLWLIIPFILFHFIQVKFSRKPPRFLKTLIILFLFLSSTSITTFFNLGKKLIDNQFSYELSLNKSKQFVYSYIYFNQLKEVIKNAELEEEIIRYYELNNINDKTYFDFPFFNEDTPRNDLGHYFQMGDTSPNVVFIFCESLGSQFVGDNTTAGSFMPFFDSLAQKGLYWKNCFANAERTFGVLPNVLGGLPEGENGFLNLKANMPDHITLPALLKSHNQYQTAFFCGADKDFDNMNDFLMYQNFDIITGKSDFSLNENKSEVVINDGSKRMFNWGAEDKVVFQESFDILDSAFKHDNPYLNVYLTTSSHPPFNYSNENFYIQKTKTILLKRNLLKDYQDHVETFASYLYLDDALKAFFHEYSNRAEFKNTIFVICGDHSVYLKKEKHRIENFRVPLLIYSPLIKHSKQFEKVISQKDIVVSLQGLLKHNFNLNLPDQSIGLGQGLLTEHKMNKPIYLMFADKTLSTVLQEPYFMMNNELFKISNNTIIAEHENDSVVKHLTDKLLNYQILSAKLCSENKLIPKEIASRWLKHSINYKCVFSFDTKSERFQINEFSLSNVKTYGAYEGQSCYEVRGTKYLNLIKEIPIENDKRYLYQIKFAIKAQNAKPLLVCNRLDSIGNKVEKVFYLNTNQVKPLVEKNGWYFYELSTWLEKQNSILHQKELSSIYFFQNDESTYWIDNIKVEIKEF